ncbi:MAG: hypothetical protein JSV21_09380 [Nitrospirota bacterium]|nr:MAG: hypothetical protein JSV21_09380 [Nitrospirota bacterium]
MKRSRFVILLSSFFILFTIMIFTGCATFPVTDVTSRTLLDVDEGILITKIRTNVNNSYIYIHGKDEKWPWVKFKPVKAPEDLRVIKIKSGESNFSKFFRGDSFVWGDRNYFFIKPGTITYVGDLVVEWSSESGGPAAYILLIDREDETVAEAKEKYPEIFEKYPYFKKIPKQCSIERE